jgi:hypothetical protein
MPSPSSSCSACGSSNARKACGGCERSTAARYCDATCQRAHWQVHAAYCLGVSATTDKTKVKQKNDVSGNGKDLPIDVLIRDMDTGEIVPEISNDELHPSLKETRETLEALETQRRQRIDVDEPRVIKEFALGDVMRRYLEVREMSARARENDLDEWRRWANQEIFDAVEKKTIKDGDVKKWRTVFERSVEFERLQNLYDRTNDNDDDDPGYVNEASEWMEAHELRTSMITVGYKSEQLDDPAVIERFRRTQALVLMDDTLDSLFVELVGGESHVRQGALQTLRVLHDAYWHELQPSSVSIPVFSLVFEEFSLKNVHAWSRAADDKLRHDLASSSPPSSTNNALREEYVGAMTAVVRDLRRSELFLEKDPATLRYAEARRIVEQMTTAKIGMPATTPGETTTATPVDELMAQVKEVLHEEFKQAAGVRGFLNSAAAFLSNHTLYAAVFDTPDDEMTQIEKAVAMHVENQVKAYELAFEYAFNNVNMHELERGNVTKPSFPDIKAKASILLVAAFEAARSTSDPGMRAWGRDTTRWYTRTTAASSALLASFVGGVVAPTTALMASSSVVGSAVQVAGAAVAGVTSGNYSPVMLIPSLFSSSAAANNVTMPQTPEERTLAMASAWKLCLETDGGVLEEEEINAICQRLRHSPVAVLRHQALEMAQRLFLVKSSSSSTRITEASAAALQIPTQFARALRAVQERRVDPEISGELQDALREVNTDRMSTQLMVLDRCVTLSQVLEKVSGVVATWADTIQTSSWFTPQAWQDVSVKALEIARVASEFANVALTVTQTVLPPPGPNELPAAQDQLELPRVPVFELVAQQDALLARAETALHDCYRTIRDAAAQTNVPDVIARLEATTAQMTALVNGTAATQMAREGVERYALPRNPFRTADDGTPMVNFHGEEEGDINTENGGSNGNDDPIDPSMNATARVAAMASTADTVIRQLVDGTLVPRDVHTSIADFPGHMENAVALTAEVPMRNPLRAGYSEAAAAACVDMTSAVDVCAAGLHLNAAQVHVLQQQRAQNSTSSTSSSSSSSSSSSATTRFPPQPVGTSEQRLKKLTKRRKTRIETTQTQQWRRCLDATSERHCGPFADYSFAGAARRNATSGVPKPPPVPPPKPAPETPSVPPNESSSSSRYGSWAYVGTSLLGVAAYVLGTVATGLGRMRIVRAEVERRERSFRFVEQFMIELQARFDATYADLKATWKDPKLVEQLEATRVDQLRNIGNIRLSLLADMDRRSNRLRHHMFSVDAAQWFLGAFIVHWLYRHTARTLDNIASHHFNPMFSTGGTGSAGSGGGGDPQSEIVFPSSLSSTVQTHPHYDLFLGYLFTASTQLRRMVYAFTMYPFCVNLTQFIGQRSYSVISRLNHLSDRDKNTILKATKPRSEWTQAERDRVVLTEEKSLNDQAIQRREYMSAQRVDVDERLRTLHYLIAMALVTTMLELSGVVSANPTGADGTFTQSLSSFLVDRAYFIPAALVSGAYFSLALAKKMRMDSLAMIGKLRASIEATQPK